MSQPSAAPVKRITSPKPAGQMHVMDYKPEILEDKDAIAKIRQGILNNEGYVFKGVVNPKLIAQVRDYLTKIGQSSFPTYHPLANNPLTDGCPNFHRIIRNDKRGYVQSIAEHFFFHPWNQDVFDLFENFKHIFYLKNMIGGLDRSAHLNATTKDNHITRFAFIFYPAGGGNVKRHADPVGPHQLCVPVLCVSKKGKDFKTGGGYAVDANNKVIDTDAMMDTGDVLFFNAEVIHGVAPIDPDEKMDWLSYRGRWSMIASTLKTITEKETADSVQLED